ncbi:hypothetical protein MRB53_038836 [Persea americana]|nr:hypothetical protein MRB53_038836 [Persea americana]
MRCCYSWLYADDFAVSRCLGLASRNEAGGDGLRMLMTSVQYTMAKRPTSSEGSVSPGVAVMAPSRSDPSRSLGFDNNVDPFVSTSQRLQASATTFQPSHFTSKRLFSYGSTRDDAPTIVTSAPPPPPIGTRSSTTTSSPTREATFTTDIDPRKPPMPGHFILISGLQLPGHGEGILAFIEANYKAGIVGKKFIKHSADPDCEDLVVLFDDTRASLRVFEELQSDGNLATTYVNYEYYRGVDLVPGSIDPQTNFVAQLTLVVEFKGRTADYAAIDVAKYAEDFAKSHGDVLAFEQNVAAQHPLWQFRVEYFSLRDAQSAILAAADGVKFQAIKGWTLFAKQYVPLSYGASHQSSSSKANSSTALNDDNHDAGVTLSSSGRTAWVRHNGIDHPVAPPSTVYTPSDLEQSMYDLNISGAHHHTANQTHYNGAYTTPVHNRGSVMPHAFTDRGNGQGRQMIRYDRYTGRQVPERNTRQQEIVPARIIAGLDVRTTVMLRNIPNGWTWREIRKVLDKVNRDRYNFMYLRIDFQAGKNVGYAFVNFENVLEIVKFVEEHDGKLWEPAHHSHGQQKKVRVSYATVQGLDSLIDKFRNSSVMDEVPDFRPLLIQTEEEQKKDIENAKSLQRRGLPIPHIAEIGESKDFPAPDNLAKKNRSTANAGLIGLFSPKERERFFRSQYDRGTTAQMMEDAQVFSPAMEMPNLPQAVVPNHLANYTFANQRNSVVLPPLVPLCDPAMPTGPYFSAPPTYVAMPRVDMAQTPLQPRVGGPGPSTMRFHAESRLGMQPVQELTPTLNRESRQARPQRMQYPQRFNMNNPFLNGHINGNINGNGAYGGQVDEHQSDVTPQQNNNGKGRMFVSALVDGSRGRVVGYARAAISSSLGRSSNLEAVLDLYHHTSCHLLNPSRIPTTLFTSDTMITRTVAFLQRR